MTLIFPGKSVSGLIVEYFINVKFQFKTVEINNNIDRQWRHTNESEIKTDVSRANEPRHYKTSFSHWGIVYVSYYV